MNLQYLFEIQAGLDAHIMEGHPELKGQNNLAWKILALKVELGECANEWREFKKWSNDQKSRTIYECELCEGSGVISAFTMHGQSDGYIDVICPSCEGVTTERNPLLEEYVDGLHLILSIGLELKLTDLWINQSTVKSFEIKGATVTDKFNAVFAYVYKVGKYKNHFWYDTLVESFIDLGFSLGFTWEQIEQAYLEKNKINHQRQESGY